MKTVAHLSKLPPYMLRTRADGVFRFQVLFRNHRIDFEPATSGLERDLWELKEHLVPSRIVDAFRTWTNLAARQKMFIVGLSPAIMGQIRGRGASGNFIIHGGGEVRFSQ